MVDYSKMSEDELLRPDMPTSAPTKSFDEMTEEELLKPDLPIGRDVDTNEKSVTPEQKKRALGFLERHGTEAEAATGVRPSDAYNDPTVGKVMDVAYSVAPFTGTAARAMAGARQKSLDEAMKSGDASGAFLGMKDALAEWDRNEGKKYDLFQRAIKGDTSADYSSIYAKVFDKKSGRYVVDRDENGAPYLDEQYSIPKDEARKSYAKELAAYQNADTAQSKRNAQNDLANNDAGFMANLAYGATASLGFAGEFYLGGALAKGVLGTTALASTRLGRAAQAAEKGIKLSAKARTALTAAEIAAPTVANAIARYENLTADDYRMDDDGNVNLAENADGAMLGASKALAGATFENVTEVALGKMVNKVFGATCKGIYRKCPGVKKLFDGASKRIGDENVDMAKRAWMNAAKRYSEVQKAVHFELFPVGEFAEEYVQGLGDEVLGLDTRASADTKGAADFTKDFFDWDAGGKDLFFGVMGQTIALGIGAHGMRRAHDFRNSIDSKVIGTLKLHGYDNADIAKMGINTRIGLAMQLSEGKATADMGYTVEDYAQFLGISQREVEKYAKNLKLMNNAEKWSATSDADKQRIAKEVVDFNAQMYCAATAFENGEEGAADMMSRLGKRMQKYIGMMEELQASGNYRNYKNSTPGDFESRIDWSGTTDEQGNINWKQDGNGIYIESAPIDGEGVGARIYKVGDKYIAGHPQTGTAHVSDSIADAHDWIAAADKFAQKKNADREVMAEYIDFNAQRMMPKSKDGKKGGAEVAPVAIANNAMDAVKNLDWLPEADVRALQMAAADGTEGGGYTASDGTVIMFLDNLKDANDALLTLSHEIGGHAAIAEGAKDKGLSLVDTIADVFKGSKTKDSDAAKSEYRIRRTDGQDKAGARAAAQEEGMVRGNEYRLPVASPLQKAKTAVKIWMKNHGMDAKMDDGDFEAIAAAGLRRVRMTNVGDTGSQEVGSVAGLDVEYTEEGDNLQHTYNKGKWVSDYYAQRESVEAARAEMDAKAAQDMHAAEAEREQMAEDAKAATEYGREMVSEALKAWFGKGKTQMAQIERIVNGATDAEIGEILDYIELEMDGKAGDGTVLEIAKKINSNIVRRNASDAAKKRIAQNGNPSANKRRERIAAENKLIEKFVNEVQMNPNSMLAFWLQNGRKLYSYPQYEHIVRKGKSKGFDFRFAGEGPYIDALNNFFNGIHGSKKGDERARLMRIVFGENAKPGEGDGDIINDAWVKFKRLGGQTSAQEQEGGLTNEELMADEDFNNPESMLAKLIDEYNQFEEWASGDQLTAEERRIKEEIEAENARIDAENADIAEAEEAWGDAIAMSADGKPISDPAKVSVGDSIEIGNGEKIGITVAERNGDVIKCDADDGFGTTMSFRWDNKKGEWSYVEERDSAQQGGQEGYRTEDSGLPERKGKGRNAGAAGRAAGANGTAAETSSDNSEGALKLFRGDRVIAKRNGFSLVKNDENGGYWIYNGKGEGEGIGRDNGETQKDASVVEEFNRLVDAAQPLNLESATAADIAAEEKRIRDRAEIQRRMDAPLKTGKGEVGQSLMDLGGAEGEDLFNRTATEIRNAAKGEGGVRGAWRRLQKAGFKHRTEEEIVRSLREDRFADGEIKKVGAQSIVYRAGDRVVKFRDVDGDVDEAVAKIENFNKLFPDMAYTIRRETMTDNSGKERLILEQPYVDALPNSGTEARRQLVSALQKRFGVDNVKTYGDIEEKKLLNPKSWFSIDAGPWMIDDLKDLNLGIDRKDGRVKVWDAEIVYDAAKDAEGKAQGKWRRDTRFSTIVNRFGTTEDVGNALLVAPDGKMVSSSNGKFGHDSIGNVALQFDFDAYLDANPDKESRFDEIAAQNRQPVKDALKAAGMDDAMTKVGHALNIMAESEFVDGKKISAQDAVAELARRQNDKWSGVDAIIADGGIRIDSNHSGFEIGKMPTAEQDERIREMVEWHALNNGDKSFSVDFHKDGNIVSRTYAPNVHPDSVVDDVHGFYGEQEATPDHLAVQAFHERWRRGVKSAGKYEGELRKLAHEMKDGKIRALMRGADMMSPLIPKNAVIVPMPNHEGSPIRTMLLGYCISGMRNDVDIAPALLCNPHEGSYHDKKIKKRPNITMTRDEEVVIPQGRPVIVIDNVIASGATWDAAKKVLPDAELVVLADAEGMRGAKAKGVVPKTMRTEARFTEDGEYAPTSRWRRASREESARLDNEPTIRVFRAMQVIDGKLYPPMAARVGGKLVDDARLGEWLIADERPDLAKNGKFTLNKGNGSSIEAAYNPYWHTSRSPLNDQFSSAYKRPNLVTVEVEVPVSELSSGYKADNAKDAVGEMSWHSGPVSSKLAKMGMERKVILSRYCKPVRIMDDAEVADTIAKMLKGKDISIPGNVITPSLRSELEQRGVNVEEDAQGRWRRRYAPNPSAQSLADQRISSVTDLLRNAKFGNDNATLFAAEKLARELAMQGSISPELRSLIENTQSGTPSERARGMLAASFSAHNISKWREVMQDSLISLREMEDKLGVKKNASAYYQFDRNYGFIEEAMDRFHREIEVPLAKELETNKISLDDFSMLLQALHGEERNRMIAERSPYVLKALNDPKSAPYVNALLAGGVDIDDAQINEICKRLGWIDKNGVITKEGRHFADDLRGSGATTAFWKGKLDGFAKSGMLAKAQKAVDLVRELTKRNRDLLVASGRMSQAQASAWERLSPNYVPLRSDMEMDKDAFSRWLLGIGGDKGNKGGKRYSNAEYDHAYGRGTLADNPLEFAIQQYQESLQRAYDNIARQRLAKLVRDNANLGTVFRYEPRMTPNKRARYAKAIAIIRNMIKAGTATADDIRKMNWYQEAFNADANIPTINILGANGVKHEMPNIAGLEGTKDNPTGIVAFKENGELKFIKLGGFEQADIETDSTKLDDVSARRIATAVKKQNMSQLNGFGRMMRQLTGWFSAVRTAYAPTFMVSNFGADNTQTVRNIYATFGVHAVGKFEHYAYHSFGAAKSAINGNFGNTKIQQYAKEWCENGGKIGGLATSNIADLTNGLKRTMRRLNSQKQQLANIHTMGDFARWAVDRKDDLADLAEKYNGIVEMSTRIAAYATARDMGYSIEDAISYSRDITVNFNRKGTITPWMNALYAFSNATVQDLHRSLVAFGEGRVGTGAAILAGRGAKMGFGLMLMGFLASMFGFWQDDEKDEKEGKRQWKYAKDWQKQNVMGVRIGEQTYGVPIRGISRIPYYFGHQMYEMMSGRKNVAKAAADTLALAASNATDFMGQGSSFVASATPSAFRPMVDMIDNRTFTGQQMYREPLPGQEKTAVRSEMGRKGTSDAAKTVARVLNRITGGDEGKRGLVDVQPEIIAETWNWIFGSAGKDVANVMGAATDLVTGNIGNRELRKIPYLSRLVRNLDENSAEYYEARGKYEQAKKHYNSMAELDNEDKMRKDVEEYPWLSERGANKRWGKELKDLDGAVKKLLEIEKKASPDEYDAVHQLRLKAQYQFMRRLDNPPMDDAEGVEAEREHKRAYAPLLRSSKHDAKRDKRDQKKRKRLF